MLKLIAPLCCSALVLLTACTATTTGAVVAGPLRSFQTEVAPIFAKSCAGCHSPGGSGASALTLLDASGQVNYDAARAKAGAIARDVASGEMPKSGPKLSAAQIKLIQDWQATGAQNN
ncbi:MAG: c-type cytochrome [Candidatus Sericytochromatia bacterium]|nr:c-type cytochrome [Candidatus Sericytochromatia bacterium]